MTDNVTVGLSDSSSSSVFVFCLAMCSRLSYSFLTSSFFVSLSLHRLPLHIVFSHSSAPVFFSFLYFLVLVFTNFSFGFVCQTKLTVFLSAFKRTLNYRIVSPAFKRSLNSRCFIADKFYRRLAALSLIAEKRIFFDSICLILSATDGVFSAPSSSSPCTSYSLQQQQTQLPKG